MSQEEISSSQLIIHLIINLLNMKIMDYLKYSLYLLFAVGLTLTGCAEDDEAHEPENE